MDPSEVLKTRLIMIPMMVVTGRPYGAWRDWLFVIAKPVTSWRKSLLDGLAFLSFQLPIYAVTLWVAGAEREQILTLLPTTAFLMLVVSRPFGLLLEAARGWAGIKQE